MVQARHTHQIGETGETVAAGRAEVLEPQSHGLRERLSPGEEHIGEQYGLADG